jgi:hypothetical protein
MEQVMTGGASELVNLKFSFSTPSLELVAMRANNISTLSSSHLRNLLSLVVK